MAKKPFVLPADAATREASFAQRAYLARVEGRTNYGESITMLQAAERISAATGKPMPPIKSADGGNSQTGVAGKVAAASTKEPDEDFAALYASAYEAGQRAAQAVVPVPMVVKDEMSGKVYAPIMDGVCGFAWVTVRPGTSRFARWLKKSGEGHSSSEGGVMIWISAYNQSMARKEAHAEGMARFLRAAGIDATPGSRMD